MDGIMKILKKIYKTPTISNIGTVQDKTLAKQANNGDGPGQPKSQS